MNKQLKNLAERLAELRRNEEADNISDERFHNGLSAIQDELEGLANDKPKPKVTGKQVVITMDKKQYESLLEELFDLNDLGASLQANIEGEWKEDAGSIEHDVGLIAQELGIDLDEEAKKRKRVLSTYVEDEDEEDDDDE